MALPGFSTSLKLSSDSTALTNEATTKVTANTVFQVTNTAHRVLDPTVSIVVQVAPDGVTWGAASGYTVDYLFGKITFATDQGAASAVRISSGSCKNLVTWLEATSLNLSDTSDVVEKTSFVAGASTATKARLITLGDFSAEVSHLSSALDDQDPGTAVQKLDTLRANRTSFLIEVQFPGAAGTGSDYFRGWVVIAEVTVKSTPSNLRETTVKLEPAPFQGTGQTSYALWGFGV